jgi:hypothetical protein
MAEREIAQFGASATRATAYLLGLWGFSESVVAAIADQPAALEDLTATPAALLLTLARWHSMNPRAPLPDEPVEGGYLSRERLDRWSAVCHDAPSDAGDDDADGDAAEDATGTANPAGAANPAGLPAQRRNMDAPGAFPLR